MKIDAIEKTRFYGDIQTGMIVELTVTERDLLIHYCRAMKWDNLARELEGRENITIINL